MPYNFSVDIDAITTRFNQGLSQSLSRLESFGEQAESIGTKLSTRLSLPLTLLGREALKVASEFEQANVSFEVMLGSVEAANYLIKEFKAQASKSPLEFRDYQKAGETLLGFGVEASKVTTLPDDFFEYKK